MLVVIIIISELPIKSSMVVHYHGTSLIMKISIATIIYLFHITRYATDYSTKKLYKYKKYKNIVNYLLSYFTSM